jgi:murein DD-endopeptidase MepM/ murein hydrolase activator NlpD
LKILVLRNSTARSSTFCLTSKQVLIAGVLCLFVLPVTLGVGGYLLTSKLDKTANPFADPAYRDSVVDRVSEQQQELEKTREYVRQHLDVLGQRVGRLQAQVSRINAVGMRIAEDSGLDFASFQFDQDPPVGGASEPERETEQADIQDAIELIESELALRESEISAMDFLLSRRNLEAKQTPTGWPVKGGWVSSKFGKRLHPVTGGHHFHKGVDIPGQRGADILSVADGVVTRSENKGNYGWLVEVDHGDGYKTLYAHNKANTVKVGDTVSQGQPIAKLGSTGRSTGPHLHFEVSRNGKVVNPIRYLYKKG